MEYGNKRDCSVFSTASNDASSRQPVMVAIAEVWERFQETVPSRLVILEQASTALKDGTLGDDLRQQAKVEAHNIAGAAGVFGVIRGSQLARKIEHLLQSAETPIQTHADQFSELIISLRSELEQPLQ